MRSNFDEPTWSGKEGIVYVESTVATVPTLRALSQRQRYQVGCIGLGGRRTIE